MRPLFRRGRVFRTHQNMARQSAVAKISRQDKRGRAFTALVCLLASIQGNMGANSAGGI